VNRPPQQDTAGKILVLNLPGRVLKAGSRWYNTARKRAAHLRYYPYPWMMGYLTSLLKSHGYDVVFKDAVAMEWSVDETREYVERLRPRYLICEPTWVSSEDDRRFLDSLDEKIVRIAVGNYATNFPFECLETARDLVVVGEYEFSILEFFEHQGRQLPCNFVGRRKRDFAYPELVEDLDRFPFPERDDVPLEYYNDPSCYGVNVVVVSSRGCRLKCDFCNVEAIYGRHAYRTRSAKNVVDELEYLQKNYRFDEVYFDDDNMVSRKSHIVGICKEIIERQLKIRWLCMGDGLVDDETLEWLARAGCTTYKFGLEHLDPDVLRAIPKRLKPERSLEIIKRCKELGMRSYTCLIVGLPRSTREKDLATIKRVIAAGPDLIQFAIATPYPGTVFHRKAAENAWLVSDNEREFDVTGASAVSYPDYPAEEITRMLNLAWRLWHRHALRHPRKLWFYVKSEMRRNGLGNTLAKGIAYFIRMLQPTSP